MNDLVIVVPVLRRPWRVEPLMASIEAGTPEPHRTLFVVNDDDQAEVDALEAAGADMLVVPAARRSWAKKINDGYRASVEPWLFLAADDIDFKRHWFSRALEWEIDTTAVIGTNDRWNPRVQREEHSTHTLVRRSYIDERGTIDQPGLVVHEGYGHDYADDELVETAKARGVYVHAPDSIVAHLRPKNRADEDEVYRLGRQHSAQGKRLFTVRRKLWLNPQPAAPPRAVVVTASYGGVDAVLRAPATQDIRVEWLCFTDNPNLHAPAPWRIVHAPAEHDHPCLAAKVHKITPRVDCTDIVWIDASMEITSRSFVRSALAARHDGIAAFRHPRRDDIYLEAEASLGAEGQDGKYADQPLLDQVAAYRAEGHPEHGGLYACGVVAWDLADPKAAELGKAWLAENVRWSFQDQLSLPVVARRLGVNVGVFPVRQIERSDRRGFLANKWLRIWSHSTPAPTPTRPVKAPNVSVVIPFASEDPHRLAALQYVRDWYAEHFPAWQLVVGGGIPGSWSKGATLANLVEQASHDLLVIADADCITRTAELAEAVARVAAGEANWAVPHRTVYRLTESHTARVLDGHAPQPRALDRPKHNGTVGGGIVVVTRDAWNTVGGIDPRFIGWGGEDMAFGWALETLCGKPIHLTAPLYHLWHPSEVTGKYRRGSPEAEALAGRYRDARRDPDAMRALVDEIRTPVAA